MTKKHEYIYQQWLASDVTSVRQAYARPSANKILIENRLKYKMKGEKGWGYKVLSHTCQFFTIAYMVDDNQMFYSTGRTCGRFKIKEA